MIYPIIKHAHSGFRWLVLISLIYAIINAILKYRRNTEYGSKDKIINVIALGVLHTQLLLGLFLYFISPVVVFSSESMSNRLYRFFLLEHLSLMFLAATLLTVGFIKAKRISESRRRHQKIMIFYLLCLLVILLGIPWPWLNLGGKWF